LNMPVMTGWEFLDHQRLDPLLVNVPVVVITAIGNAQKAAVEASAILHKPVTLDELLDAVERFTATA
jgi:CheY-like chemotaxis protein